MRRILALCLVLLLVVSLVPITSLAAPTANQKTREIAVVFDNSGSMYGEPEEGRDPVEFSKAWCRAIYGMEVFASMMKPQDKMVIYPMHPCTLGANGTETYSEQNPLVITKSTASKLRELYTSTPSGTPFGPAETAYNALKQSSADEAWLILMTDANKLFNDAEGNSMYQPQLAEKLSSFTGINLMYLGIGSDSIVPKQISGPNFYQSLQAKSSTEVLACLSDMCNTIFGRNKLTNVGKTVSYDLPMTELIVFVQGAGISDVKLGNLTPKNTVQMKYPEQGAGSKYAELFNVDEDLQGIMAFYENLEAAPDGLELTYSGNADDVVVFFEPNVDLQVQLLDAAGNPVDVNSKELISGTYIIDYCIVDKDGNKVTSELLANAKYEIKYFLDGQEHTETATEAGSIAIDIGPNQKLRAEVTATFLKDYNLRKTSEELNWPAGGLTFIPPPAGTLEIRLTEGKEKYNLSSLPTDTPFRVEFFYDGQPLTKEQLSSLEDLQVKIEGGNLKAELKTDDSGYYVAFDYNGSALETKCGKFEVRVSAAYRNQDGELTNVALGSAKSNLHDNSRNLEMKVTVKQDYYQLSKLKQGKPVQVRVTYSGDALTKEELDALTFTCSAKSFKVLVEKDYEKSSFMVRFDPKDPPSSGDHTLRFTVSGVNEIGKEVSAKKSAEVEFGVLPLWLKILLIVLLIVLILAIILFILNQKVLPKKIYVKDMELNVDGEAINVKRSPVFDGAGKRRGSIKIYSPRAGSDPLAEQAMFLTVQAVSPRRTPSRQRKARVTAAQLKSPQNVIYWKLKTHAYEPDPEKPGGFIHTVTGQPIFKEVDLGSSNEIEIQAETDDSSVIFRAKIGFK